MKKLIPITVISVLMAALVAGSVAWGVMVKSTPVKEELSFIGERAITIKEVTVIATRYCKEESNLNLDFFKRYNGYDVSSSTLEYHMEYFAESEDYTLIVYAGIDKTITAMYIRRASDREVLEVNKENEENIDDFTEYFV